MRKFTFGYMIVLAIFVIGGIVMLIFSSKGGTPEIDEKLINKAPGLSTSLAFEKIIKEQQLGDFIINIQAKQVDKRDSVDLQLAAPEFATEESLLMDSYNILSEATSITALEKVTLTWQQDENALLTFTISKASIDQLPAKNYEDIKLLAETYSTASSLK